ncbi:DUF7691 family protein [Myroides sp. LJL119]
MQYYIFSYAVKSAAIQKVFNSKDQSVFDKVVNSDVFQKLSIYSDKANTTTYLQALKDIIWGNSYDSASNLAYGYALIGILDTYAIELPFTRPIPLGLQTDYINQVLREHIDMVDFEMEKILLQASHRFEIPKMTDFPIISCLDASSLKILDLLFQDISISPQVIKELQDSIDDQKGDAYQDIMGLKQNIAFCVEKDLEMVLVCY